MIDGAPSITHQPCDWLCLTVHMESYLKEFIWELARIWANLKEMLLLVFLRQFTLEWDGTARVFLYPNALRTSRWAIRFNIVYFQTFDFRSLFITMAKTYLWLWREMTLQPSLSFKVLIFLHWKKICRRRSCDNKKCLNLQSQVSCASL